MLEIVVRVLLLLSQQTALPEAAWPVQAEQLPQAKLGTTDSAAGESRRNENVQFNLIDNNARLST